MADHIENPFGAAILPHKLQALARRGRDTRAGPTATRVFTAPPTSARGPIQAGIRDTGSGTMTVTGAPLKMVMTMLAERAARRRGLLADDRLEAIAIDARRQIFAGFWPKCGSGRRW
jgi:hypothetical protein